MELSDSRFQPGLGFWGSGGLVEGAVLRAEGSESRARAWAFEFEGLGFGVCGTVCVAQSRVRVRRELRAKVLEIQGSGLKIGHQHSSRVLLRGMLCKIGW